MIKITHKGDFSKTTKFLNKITGIFNASLFDKYGRRGVEALKEATPESSGKSREAWSYSVENEPGSTKIIFSNSNVTPEGTPVVILLQYGHATKAGGWIEGIDFINPALKPIFEEIVKDITKEIGGK